MPDPLDEYHQRPASIHRPELHDTLENVLNNVANPNIDDEDLIEYLFGMLRSVEVRLEPFANAPVKGIVSVRLEELGELELPLARALVPVLRAAMQDACLKHIVDQQPG